MTTTAVSSRDATSGRPRVVLRGRPITIVGPSRRDPRLRLSAVVIALQVLGQTVLGFKVSIAQILVTVGVCAVVDATVTLARDHVLALPASGMLTGNSVAFILRASGTRHGDWWSMHGIGYFVLAALLSLGSKYLIRPGGRHLFNPSNVGLVWCLLVIGPRRLFPQYLWWGPFGLPVVLALAVILVGGVWVLRPVRMAGMALSFLVPFAVLVGIFAASGRSFVAIWHTGPISGMAYWADIALSPEVLIFVFFMMSDPQTAPKAPVGRVVYGASTAVVAAGLLFFQPTEFGIKLAILSSLTVVCALVPVIESLSRRRQGQRERDRNGSRTTLGAPVERRRRLVTALSPGIIAALVIAVAAPAGTAALARNTQLINIERGLTPDRNPQ
jgi:Na+-transporting NADH:ubiquinone oxidoreductase subunit NqrB